MLPAPATHLTARFWRGFWQATTRKRRDDTPMSRRHFRPATMARWRPFPVRPRSRRRSGAPQTGLHESRQEAPEDHDLLGDPAAAIVGIDHRVVDARRAALAVIHRGAKQNVPDREHRGEIAVVDVYLLGRGERVMDAV